jgi:hypothetical protein
VMTLLAGSLVYTFVILLMIPSQIFVLKVKVTLPSPPGGIDLSK